jgi:hypothetical protein
MKVKPKTQSKQGSEAKPPGANLSPLDQELWELTGALHVPFIRDRILNTRLTEEERQLIAADDTIGSDIIEIWSKVRGISAQRAVVDLAREMNLRSEADARQLLRALGEPDIPADVKPTWDKETGKICLGGLPVKTVHRLKAATNVSRILNSFHEEGWPPQIADPLPPIKELKQSPQQRLQDAVNSLNDRLKLIRFHLVDSGEGVLWERL